ncbi:site-2 protease family protein [bacterium]|nr:site-2 protease family protein [bacterium]
MSIRKLIRAVSNPFSRLLSSIPGICVHIFLFILTIGTTYLVGFSDGPVGALWYSGAIITILLSHEMGHYLMTRKHRIAATLPYFIPFPLPPFGTMGALIKIKSPITDRRALLDIGAAGPLAGMIPISFALYFGLKFSQVVDIKSAGDTTISLGNSILFSAASRIIVGHLEKGQDILLHPLAFAAWAGLLVTAINLLPIGQLDGGHIIYALLRDKSSYFFKAFYIFLLTICLFYYAGWFLFIIILAILRKHPPTVYDHIPLDNKRKIIGIFAMIIFVLAFTPVPFGFGKGLIPLITGLIR